MRALREVKSVLSICIMIIGIIFIFMGVVWYWAREVATGALQFITALQDWNAYVLVIGLLLFGIGVYYLYTYMKDKKFVLKELKTNKRSELLKRHNELRAKVKHLPSKYQTMVREKEEELGIR